MAAKHDGKRAAANMWVTHQNLARAKGGRPQYKQPVKKGLQAPPKEPEVKAEEKVEAKADKKPKSKSRT